jgi:hypothetical protein
VAVAAALALVLGLGAIIYFYPLPLRFRYENGRPELAWLPRMGGGYAKPRLLWPAPARARRASAASPLRRGLFRLYLGNAKQPVFNRPLFRRLIKHAAVDKLDCRIQIGAADPFATSLLAGSILTVLESLGAVLLTAVRDFPARPWLQVAPLAQGGFDAHLECIFHLRGGDIIGDALYYLWLTKGRRANGK